MYKSFYIVNETLYLSKASITTLASFLSVIYTEDQLQNSDKATIVFLGMIQDNKYYGTFRVTGNKVCEKALPYLTSLTSENSKINFSETSDESFNKAISNVTYPLISDPYYEGIPFKKENL